MTENHSFDFFISHSSKTEDLAMMVYFIARLNGLNPWYDEALLSQQKDTIKDALKKGIQSSKGFLILHSRPALESEFVQYEIDCAIECFRENQDFRIKILKLDDMDVDIPEFRDIQYLPYSLESPENPILLILEYLTEKKLILPITFAAVLNSLPIFGSNQSLADLRSQYLISYIAQVKTLLEGILISLNHRIGDNSEYEDTLRKILKLNLLQDLPNIPTGGMLVEPEIWEFIHANRMYRTPDIILQGLPDRYFWKIVENNEIFTRISIYETELGHPVSYPVPFSIIFEARL